MTFTIGEFIGVCVGIVTFIGAIAGMIIWAYSTFITRIEAEKMEHAVDRIIAEFRKPINEQLAKFEKKMDEFIEKARA